MRALIEGLDADAAMNTSTVTSPLVRKESGRAAARRFGPRTAARETHTVKIATQRLQPFELDTSSSQWQLALDAAQRALTAAGGSLPAAELEARRRELVRERQRTAKMLARLAQITGARPEPWLSPVPVTRKMLGLPDAVSACLFDLDGVLTDSAVLHASAWGEVLDELLLRLAETTGWQFIPFDRSADYDAYIEGRLRLEGIHAFLGSRGIRLPEGSPGDPAQLDTACGLAKRKAKALAGGLRERGVNALPGARRYLEAIGHAGIKRAVVSASTSTLPMLELAGMTTLVEERIDADVIRAERLRSRPAPDLLLAACRRLDVRPETAVTFTHSAAGLAAGHEAGLTVIGVDDGGQGTVLQGIAVQRVVPSLSALLDPQLSDSRSNRLRPRG
jgi:HAD superfamily hydrolase (TIGR01509 family)